MRHPCEPSEYQFHYDRAYLRSPANTPTSRNVSTMNQEAGAYQPTNQEAGRRRYHMPNRDLDLMFGVRESRVPGECVAKIQYDRGTGEVLSIKPLTGSTPHPSFPTTTTTQRQDYSRTSVDEKKESVASLLTLRSFTRHGYNVEHIRGAISGPLPGMQRREPAGTGKHRHDPTLHHHASDTPQ